MHYTCWPHYTKDHYLTCECGQFKMDTLVPALTETRRAYREHVKLVEERERNRWHQEPT